MEGQGITQNRRQRQHMSTTKRTSTGRHLLRLLAGLTAAVLIALVPAVAQAAFRATATASFTASTYEIPAPASITGTYSCGTKPNSYNLNMTAYGKVAKATAYRLTITAPDGTSTSQTITGNTLNLTKTSARAGTYTLTLIALVGTWTGDPLTRTYSC
jgi:hypothetical protein